MTSADAIKAFGGTQSALAKALGISQGSVSLWGEYPPELRQLQLEALTNGALTAEAVCDKFRVPARKHIPPELVGTDGAPAVPHLAEEVRDAA